MVYIWAKLRKMFRTTVPQQKAPFKIGYTNRMMLLGSCFTEAIGSRLIRGKFNCFINPFGIVYNPISIARTLERLIAGNAPFLQKESFEFNGLWHSWEHHGSFSHPDQSQALANINEAYYKGVDFLKSADRLLLTLGNAHVFERIPEGIIVANNHKVPSSNFRQRRLSVSETTDALAAIFQKLLVEKPNLGIVLTVSPVRHLRLGFEENQRSKSVLLLACDELAQQFPQVIYCPAYELLIDDLRDYRFYNDDMLHPTNIAANYIFNYFQNMFFDGETVKILTEVLKVVELLEHKPLHPESQVHYDFLIKRSEIMGRLINRFPFLEKKF